MGSDFKAVLADYRRLGVVSLNAYASQITRVNPPRRRDPSLKIVDPIGNVAIKRGKKGTIVVKINGARPSLDHLRVKLGQGIYAIATSVKSFESGFGSTIKIVYKVGANAKPGPRKLSLQFGDIRFYKENAIVVQAGG